MALRLGSLYVSLSASTGPFMKGLDAALKASEKFLKETKRVAAETAAASAVFAGMGMAALSMAKSVDGPTKTAMTNMENSSKLLAVQIADMLLPAVREMSAMFKTAAGVVAGLDPETKKQISTFAVLAVQLAVVAKAVSVFSGLAGNAFGILRSGLAAVASVGLAPLLSIAAVIGTVVAVVVLLHRAWRKNWGGIQEITADVLQWFRDAFTKLGTFFGKVWDFLVDGAARFVEGILTAIDKVQELTGKKLIDTGSIREGLDGTWKDLKSGAFFSQAFEFGKTVGAQVADGLSEELSLIKSELGIDKLLGSFKPGKTIGLGRGMGPTATASNGHEGIANMSMSAHEQEAARALKDIADEAARFKKELADVAAGQEVRKFLSELSKDVGSTLQGGLAKVSLSDPALLSSRRGSFTKAATTAGQRGEPKTSDEKMSQVMNDAKNADSWGGAMKALNDGFGEAADAGMVLATWGARMGPMLAQAGLQLLGAVGDLVNSVVEGAKQGGIWGAIIAAIMEIAKKTESAMKFLDTAMGFIQVLAEMVEPLVKPIFDALTELLGSIVVAVRPLFKALQPLFDGIAKIVTGLQPVFVAIGYVMEAIGPIIEVVGKVVGVIADMLGPIFEIVGTVLKVVATVVLGILIGLNELAAVFGDEKARAEADRMKSVVDKMWAPGAKEREQADVDAANAAIGAASANNELAASAREVTEALINVPAGYRIAFARFQADTGAAAAVALGAGASGASTPKGPLTAAEQAEVDDATGRDERDARIENQRGRDDGSDSQRKADPFGALASMASEALTIMGDVIIYSSADNWNDLAKAAREGARRRGQQTGSTYPQKAT
jgi:hypothetical protein